MKPAISIETQLEPVQALDRLSCLLDRFQVSARLFHTGALCGISTFEAQPGRGFFHVLRAGEMVVTHRQGTGLARRIEAREPTLFFYPQALTHRFHNAPKDGADFTCASVYFEGGANHPLVQALPPLIVLPLAKVPGLAGALTLLFEEADAVRCGHRLIADRLFEVVLLQLLRWLLDHGRESGIAIGLVSGLADPQLARALTAMHEHPEVSWTVESLADRAAMSRSAFASAFKKTVGVTPADYLTDWRLAIARKRLRQGQAVKAIAPALGYANASALSRVFAQRVGMSPREWLAQVESQEGESQDGESQDAMPGPTSIKT
ncbi:AraC family transcriptional regulator [Pigmentiphaga aceris]|uniref:AraC family transcriptional regulator n=1 Tax=Pigmentiphaga aceris TaxID=1940612 RepID=A0A5C0B0Y6_9BURK|nr:AraC family transcriptional regulator [Pigmentiphaga aceris]QEI08312.1 AraC family transcriptional regulator [Pigmentiphaga aceris]